MTEKEFVDAVSLSGALRQQAADLVGKWTAGGLPGRDGLEAAATVLKEASLGGGLWSPPPVMLKLSIPTEPGFYDELIAHPQVLRVVALSGGYSREEANELLAQNHNLIASFSRALTEGLSVQQSDDEFNATLDESIQSIFDASMT